MSKQGVTISALRHFTFSDFFTLFRVNVAESHALMQAVCEVLAFFALVFALRTQTCAEKSARLRSQMGVAHGSATGSS